MKIGVDFGTSHISAQAWVREKPQSITFTGVGGQEVWAYPTLIAIKDRKIEYGFHAQARMGEKGWSLIRSIKSHMRGMCWTTEIEVEGQHFLLRDLLVGLFQSFRLELSKQKILKGVKRFSINLGTPAQADASQRYYTSKLFLDAGFEVGSLHHEPSAAAMHFIKQNYKNKARSKKEYIIVYDLGAGTFDISIALFKDEQCEVVASGGLNWLGGDLFDERLATMVKEKAGIQYPMSYQEETYLLECCRLAKESLTPQNKYVRVQWALIGESHFDWEIPVADYNARCQDLIEQTIEITDQLMEQSGIPKNSPEIAAIYLVGGMSLFPEIANRLAQRFKKDLIKRSLDANLAVTFGLAQLAEREPMRTPKMLPQHLGIWREAENGTRLIFDPIFFKGETFPKPNEGAKIITRRYHPKHNIAVFSFQTCNRLEENIPKGLTEQLCELKLPLCSDAEKNALNKQGITRYSEDLSHEVEEVYELDPKGDLLFRFINHQTGFTQVYQLNPS